jgi:hypothetical protein
MSAIVISYVIRRQQSERDDDAKSAKRGELCKNSPVPLHTN